MRVIDSQHWFRQGCIILYTPIVQVWYHIRLWSRYNIIYVPASGMISYTSLLQAYRYIRPCFRYNIICVPGSGITCRTEQAVTWTSVDQDLCYHIASLDKISKGARMHSFHRENAKTSWHQWQSNLVIRSIFSEVLSRYAPQLVYECICGALIFSSKFYTHSTVVFKMLCPISCH